MFEYLKGNITEHTHTHIVVDINGLGYFVNISLNTYSQIKKDTKATIYLHQIVRDDAHILYGFADKAEREIFRLLISVSGIGANTARMILSSLSPSEVVQTIKEGNVNILKSVKGIGVKTAQRVIIDLKDKVGKAQTSNNVMSVTNNTKRNEALSALTILGFSKAAIEKVLDKIIDKNKEQTVEELIKLSLKKL